MYKTIHLDAPNVGALEKRFLARAIDEGYVSTVGPFVPEFEDRFARYIDVKQAVSTQSGTSALHLALHELRIGFGDEVIVPALTFVGTVNPVMYVGAKPVFADIDPLTWDMDKGSIKKLINDKTKAIIVVHLYGNPCDMDEIMALAKDKGLFIIEDATESLGAKFKGVFTGTFGDFGAFSFNGNKVITTGGGGMVVGKDQKKLEHIRFLVNQARDESKGYFHPEIGFNDRMTNIEAALGLAQLERLDIFLRKKKKFNSIYRDELSGIKSIKFQEENGVAESSFWMSCITVEGTVNITKLQKQLNLKRVPTRRLFMPILEFPPYQRYKKGTYKNSYYVYRRGLSLPSSTINSEDDVRYACDCIRKAMRGAKR